MNMSGTNKNIKSDKNNMKKVHANYSSAYNFK